MSDNAIKIAPSILAADFSRLGEQVIEAQDAGADLIQINLECGRLGPELQRDPAGAVKFEFEAVVIAFGAR